VSFLGRVAEQAVGVDGVPVAPPVPGPGEVAGGFQIGHDGLHGAFGEADDGGVEDELTSALDDGLTVLVADGTRTTFCASAGVSTLIRVHHQAEPAGTQLRVVAGPAVRRILDLTGADQVLDTYPSLADALAGRHTPSTT